MYKNNSNIISKTNWYIGQKSLSKYFLFPAVPLLLGIENGIVTKNVPSKCGDCRFAWMVDHFNDFQTIWNETHQTGYGECPLSFSYYFASFNVSIPTLTLFPLAKFVNTKIAEKNSETNFDTDIKTSSKILPKAQDWNVMLCWTNFYLHRIT